MSGFSADWLRLREPFDHGARKAAAADLGGADWAAHQRRPTSTGRPLSVIDLGCGTGANLRYLAPRIGGKQQWQVYDHDAELLAAWPGAMAEWATRDGHAFTARGDTLHLEGAGFTAVIERRRLDLSRHLDAVPFADADLVCASALLDLVSHDWLAMLIAFCGGAGIEISFALTADGRIVWDMAAMDDMRVAEIYARHQRRDKGFGPALGTQAPACATRLLVNAGYHVRDARSDWVVADGALQRALIEGMAAAATEEEPGAAIDIANWQRGREALADRSTLRVGHVDIVARPGVR
jgi:SAM-dependent methyltransferase